MNPIKLYWCLLTGEVVASPNLFLRPMTVVSTVLRRGIGTGSNKLLKATTTSFGAFWDGLPRSKTTVNSFKMEDSQLLSHVTACND